MLLEEKVVIVTGAAQGIGAFTAREFCREGARVVLSDIDESRLGMTTSALAAAGYDVFAARLDVRDRESVRRVTGEIVDRYGRIDVLVNNAGAYPRRNFLDMGDEEWDQILDLNLNGTYNCAR